MALGDVQQTVRDAIGRGTALDGIIPTYVRQAARWIERNSAYKYMEQFGALTLNSSAAFPHVVDLPSTRVRNITMFRIMTADGRYHYLRKIDPRDVINLGTSRPRGYQLIGYGKIILDSKPSENFQCELIWNQFTPWPTDLAASNWLIDNADDVLVNQTMVLMAPYLRDPRLIQTYKQVRDECLATLEGSRYDLEESNASDVMQYGVGSES